MHTGKVLMHDVEVDTLKIGAMDPEFIAKQIAFNGSEGTQVLPGGVIMKWGKFRAPINGETSLSVVFAVPFAQEGKWTTLAGAQIVLRPGFSFAEGVVPAGVSITRPTAGTFVDSAGVVQTAPIHGARINYRFTGGAWVTAGIVNEPLAINLFLQSEAFENASWSKAAGNLTVTATADVIGPDGLYSARLVSEHPTIAGGNIDQVVSVVAGQTYYDSWYIKENPAVPKRYWGMQLSAGSFGNNRIAAFDPANGAFTGGQQGASALNTYTERLGNGWSRVAFWWTATVTGQVTIRHFLSTSATASGVTGGAGSSMYIAKAQFEAGALTSHIRTLAAQVTRAADVIAIGWAGQGVADGAITACYTFDDGTTQDVTTTVAGGTSTIPTNLNRPNILRVEKI